MDKLMDRLKKECQDYLDFLDSDDFNEDRLDDYEHCIFEAALETFHGKDIWDVVNSKL